MNAAKSFYSAFILMQNTTWNTQMNQVNNLIKLIYVPCIRSKLNKEHLITYRRLGEEGGCVSCECIIHMLGYKSSVIGS